MEKNLKFQSLLNFVLNINLGTGVMHKLPGISLETNFFLLQEISPGASKQKTLCRSRKKGFVT